jgi:hypothetical protein
MYRTLDAAKIVSTLETLERRIGARFPGSGLSSVAAEVTGVARRTAQDAAAFAKPNLWLRGATIAATAAGLVGQIWMARSLHLNVEALSVVEFAQGLESAVNLLLLMAAAVWFLLTLEERLKRRKILDALHELRSLAHVIDMHQLTKDPTIVLSGHSTTEASPASVMTEFELARYLDYCAEMLALAGKLAALYAAQARDPAIIGAVNEIENLCTDLGRKIWQKIMIISQLDERR